MRVTFDLYLEMTLEGRLPCFFSAPGNDWPSDQSGWVITERLGQIAVDVPSEDLMGRAHLIATSAAERLADQQVIDEEGNGKLPHDWRSFGRAVAELTSHETLKFNGGLEAPNPAIRCPDCQSAMVKRQSRRGLFYGCSEYPKCRGSRPISQ